MKDHLETYETYRERMAILQRAAVDFGLENKNELFVAAKKLGMYADMDGGALVVESESDLFILMDMFLYEIRVQQQRIIVSFLEQNPAQSDVDQELATAMRQSHFGLYRLDAIDAERSELQLKALVPDLPDAMVINRNFAKTATLGMILAMRLLRLPKFSLSSGVLFPFEPGTEKRVIREWWRMQGMARYAHFHHLSRKEPIHAYFGEKAQEMMR